MDLLLSDFENLKISAFSKYCQINSNINQVTIGPNSTLNKTTTKSVDEADNLVLRKKTPKKPVRKEDKREEVSPFRHILKEFDFKRQEKVEEAVSNRCKQFKDFEKLQKEQQKNEWVIHQQSIIRDMQQHEENILRVIREYDANKSYRNEKLVNKHYQDMVQRKLQYKEQIEKAKEKQRICKQNIEKINKYQIDFRIVFEEIIGIIKTSPSTEDLRQILGDNFNLLKTIPESMENLVSNCKVLEITETDLMTAADLLVDLKNLKLQIEAANEQIIQKKKQREAAIPPPKPIMREPQQPSEQPSVEKAVFSLHNCISVSNLKNYSEIKQFLIQYPALYNDLLTSESYKQFRFDCKKAVNIPVNALSAINSDHLKDKYIRLHNLLAGKSVIVGDKQVNASQHPQGIAFCMDLLAKKFVLQGDLMISSNPEAAFCYSTLILSLWNDFPDFGKLLLGYFYTQCPYLIPFHIPRTEGQSDEEYYTSLGYCYTNGEIEKQNKFLKRMTGIMRLYFALFISKPRRGQNKSPHNIRNAWHYLVSILKIEPQMDITATALHTLLETVGFEMDATYGNAFRKILRILIEKFLPALKKICTGGAVSRLETLLEDYKRYGKFERPNGILSPNFW